ncbi:uncharacterized protein LOC109863617 isoform X2 [Pseudomyrmex gracilis]|uniref:uncharacterized protein LOC109863617 isoform X2 n=1 Tax=Pseudomyrmex gracilis TaxID=219809 RepID=UPI000994CAB1|nr:uncharacterized protein LOC109863617 isoform X2 [Pseudomyrmex gracilis]
MFELLFRRSVLGSSYKQATIDKFENDTLKVFFRLYLDRRKIPRSITNVEDTIKDIIIKETYSISSLFKNMEIDLRTVSVKRINQESAVTQKHEQQKHAMIIKNGLLRSNRNGSLITIPKQKTKPIRRDSVEPNIDFSNIPTIQGIYTATKINVTEENKRTAELVTESIDETTVIQERTTALNEISNLKEPLPTNELPTAFIKRTIIALSDHMSDGQTVDAIKTMSLESTTSQSTLDTFKDFRNPDFETSLWRPIVSGFINTQFKLFPRGNVKEIDHTTESSTQETASSISDNPKLPTRSTISTDLSRPGMMNIFDTENTKFPQDGIISDLTISRPDTAYKNNKPDIEVVGQLPLEMFSVKLKANHNNNEMVSTLETSKTHKVIKNITIEDNVFHRELNTTEKVEEKFNNLLSTTESDNNESHDNDKIVTPLSGIGVAEPVPDSEIELEAKNQYSNIVLRNNKDKESLRDRKVNSSLQQPVYTSYNTSDLNGGNFISSLIELPVTTKPFRHTIPVDKVTSVVNYKSNVSLRNLSISSLLNNVLNRNTTESNALQSKTVTLLPSVSEKTIKEILITENNDAIQLPNYEQNTSTDLNLARMNNNKLKQYVSRNSTFVEIDIVKYTPDDLEENSESYAADNGITKDELQKKIYNDTLKAYVIENSFVRNNEGIGKPMRAKSKIKDLSVDETTFLEQLLRVHDYTHKNDTININKSNHQFSSYEIQVDPTKYNEEKSKS